METVGADAVVSPRASRLRLLRARLRPRVTIGGDVRLGRGVVLRAQRGARVVVGDWAHVEGDAVLEDRSRLAAHAVALSGARVGTGAVIGSYAVVDGRVAPRAVLGRAPRSSS